MLAANIWTMIGLVGSVGLVCLMLGWIGFLVFLDGQSRHHQQAIRPKFFPSLIPWSEASKLRRTKLQRQILEEQAELYKAKHAAKQQEMIYGDLEEQQMKEYTERANNRGLGMGED